MVLIRPDPSVADARFVRYWLNSPAMAAHVRGHRDGSVAERLNLPTIRDLPVALPPLGLQRRIADILGALDDKIELNGLMVATLREVARTLSSEALTGDLRPLSTIATAQRGFGYRSAGFADGGTPMISMGSAKRRGWLKRNGIREYGEPVAEKYHVHPWDLLVVNVDLTWRLEVLGWPLIVPADLADAVVSNDIYVLQFDADHAWRRALVWAALQGPSARALVEGAAKGTTVASIATTDVLAVPAVGSDSSRSRALARAAEASIERAWNAEREALRLSELRAALLPKLLSGELEVVA
jgi:type I restriction enzyme S subunit